jgi:hypothetical protein
MLVPDQSIEVHAAYMVLELVLAATLVNILMESNRLLSDEGVATHHIDLSDHFSDSDRNIRAVNFLRFSSHSEKNIPTSVLPIITARGQATTRGSTENVAITF